MSVFLNFPPERIVYRDDHFFIVFDGYPASPGHCLIISNIIRETYFELTNEEKLALPAAIDKAQALVKEKHNPDGYNIGMNCGKDAGQSVPHFHCHVIPRYSGDVEDPQGGVRSVIPHKRKYQKKANKF
ncbi:MAG: HIT family protein [Methylococcales bacterium]|jgi:diadenosine tetraphosphate (Ap4A) HIT family hydrolase|nr:HIT family protein [Methylococcales bacterium]MBT7445927.1 HIT family protein [Methylococcales bacterium]